MLPAYSNPFSATEVFWHAGALQIGLLLLLFTHFQVNENMWSNFSQRLHYFRTFLNCVKYTKDKRLQLFNLFNDEMTVTSQLTKSAINAAQNIYLICLIQRSDQRSAANAWWDILLVMFHRTTLIIYTYHVTHAGPWQVGIKWWAIFLFKNTFIMLRNDMQWTKITLHYLSVISTKKTQQNETAPGWSWSSAQWQTSSMPSYPSAEPVRQT